MWSLRGSADLNRPLYQVYEADVHVREFQKQQPVGETASNYGRSARCYMCYNTRHGEIYQRKLTEYSQSLSRYLDYLENDQIDPEIMKKLWNTPDYLDG